MPTPTPTPTPAPTPTPTPTPGPVSFYPTQTPAYNEPQELETGDFNGDGILDLLVGNYSPGGSGVGEVDFLAGAADGSFAAPVKIDNKLVSMIEVGDVNRDGKLDFVAKHNGAETDPPHTKYADTLVYLGNGNGTFQLSGQTRTSQVQIRDFALRDVNGDSRLDLVAIEFNETSLVVTLAVSLQAADGTFQPEVRYPFGAFDRMTLADFNGDGFADAALINRFGVTILLNNGSGGFGSPTEVTLPNGWRLIAGDIDVDGDLDLVVGKRFVSTVSTVSVVLGRGDGTFLPPSDLTVPQDPTALGLGDLNQDGLPDILVTHGPLEGASLLLNSGSAHFQAPKPLFAGTTLGTSDQYGDVRFGDFNRDGIRDIAATVPPDKVMIAFGPFQ